VTRFGDKITAMLIRRFDEMSLKLSIIDICTRDTKRGIEKMLNVDLDMVFEAIKKELNEKGMIIMDNSTKKNNEKNSQLINTIMETWESLELNIKNEFKKNEKITDYKLFTIDKNIKVVHDNIAHYLKFYARNFNNLDAKMCSLNESNNNFS
jgi:hypothetical protein